MVKSKQSRSITFYCRLQKKNTCTAICTQDKLSKLYLHPVSEPVAFRVCALHSEQYVASRNDASFWYCLDFNGKMTVVFLPTENTRRWFSSIKSVLDSVKRVTWHSGLLTHTVKMMIKRLLLTSKMYVQPFSLKTSSWKCSLYTSFASWIFSGVTTFPEEEREK